jgi:hypothetical protein
LISHAAHQHGVTRAHRLEIKVVMTGANPAITTPDVLSQSIDRAFESPH